ILERAVPAIEDGLKPVQRRILHAMKEMDDGRFNKVANIIGATMQYHPHGDASIGDAIVGLGQKDLMIDTQGNWGDIRTGDNAAASRYIEARLSKFALEVAFNDDTTIWQLSYDGRKREPVTLPVKFPLLLAQGVEGIAVGLATKILPHNFCELIDASIKHLKNENFELYPDFATGGMIDAANYKDGLRGGKVRVRAKIVEKDPKTLLVTEIPFSTTTSSLIESIVKANDSGKIKIKKVTDNTAKDVEIEIQLMPGTSPDITIDALYAFTDCEVSISPNACVIIDDKPRFIGVSEILKLCTLQTKELLRRELEIRLAELKEKIFFSSLLKIFIEEGMYKNPLYENSEDDSKSFEVLNKLYEPHFHKFYRKIENEDYKKVMAKPLSSIRKFDFDEADLKMKEHEDEMKKINHHLAHLVEYTIDYYQNLLKKYGTGRERKTEIRQFDIVNAVAVAAANEKLYVNRKDGFVGFGLKKDEFVTECSDIDDIIVFTQTGICKVVKIADKVFVGKDIIHVSVFKKNDERMVYNMIYLDGKSGRAMGKRFQVLSVTRDKEYDLTMGNKGSKVLYFSANPNGEAEIISIQLTPSSTAKIKVFDYNFADLEIKGRVAQGNIVTKYPIKKITLKEKGKSTLGGLKIWYDSTLGRLNTESRGKLLGSFLGDDKIIVFFKDGSYEITSYELTNRYEPNDIMHISKFNKEEVVSVIHFDGEHQNYFVKRFLIEALSIGKKYSFISESKGSKLVLLTLSKSPQIEIEVAKGAKGEKEQMILDLDMLIDVKGWKALGNRLSPHKVLEIKLIQEKEEEETQTEIQAEESDSDEGFLKPGDQIEFEI
ncbi:MAG: DNA gyrase/topoisomerase IV subunit A, partial [Cytophagales bacterium]